jgi:hypothetical protein
VPRTNPCDSGVRSGRMAKAEQLADAAAVVHEFASEAADIADAYLTLCVHAGIAGGDVICCARLGEYSRGENHSEAVKLLATVDWNGSRRLQVLLDMKTRAGCSHTPVSREQVTRAGRAMDGLLRAAREAQ